MQRRRINNLDLWQFDNLSVEKQIAHFVTDRYSLPHPEEFTLSLSSHSNRDFVLQNREWLATSVGVPVAQLFFPSQVHGTNIVTVDQTTQKEQLLNTDALITGVKDICICVMSADCVPVLVFDRVNRVIAAVHSGWRGTVARILEKTLLKMHHDFGTKGADLICGIGPSVSQESYEVGEEVIQSVQSAFPTHDKLLYQHKEDRAQLDLWKANAFQLMEFGVPESNIEISQLCTVKNNDYFFSARKGDKGRFAAGIMLK